MKIHPFHLPWIRACSWEKHVISVAAKANKLLGLLKRTCPLLTDVSVRQTLYLSLIKSQLCFGTQVWSQSQHFKPRILTELLDSGTLSVTLRPSLSSVVCILFKTMSKKLYLTLLRPSMWSGRVLGPPLDCVHAIVDNILALILH